MKPRPGQGESPLTPELRDFIDRAIVPALLRQYLAEGDEIHRSEEDSLAKGNKRVSDFEEYTAAPTLRGAVRP
jgi:hypothetical protein